MKYERNNVGVVGTHEAQGHVHYSVEEKIPNLFFQFKFVII